MVKYSFTQIVSFTLWRRLITNPEPYDISIIEKCISPYTTVLRIIPKDNIINEMLDAFLEGFGKTQNSKQSGLSQAIVSRCIVRYFNSNFNNNTQRPLTTQIM